MSSPRYIAACIFLFSLITPLLWHMQLEVEMNDVRHEMKEKLERSALCTIVLPAEQVCWVEKGKELNINGRLFDVKTQFAENGLVFFTGLYDEKEKDLKDIAAGQETPGWLMHLAQQLFGCGYDNHFTAQPVLYPPVKEPIPASPALPEKYTTPFTAVAAPPPWLS